MKLTHTVKCLACDKNQQENLAHFVLHCDYFAKIREEYLPQLAILNKGFSNIVNNEKLLLLSILNPESEKLPEESKLYCDRSFKILRSFCYDIYKEREKFYEIKS